MDKYKLADILHAASRPGRCRLPNELLTMDGYTTPKQRNLLNMLCSFPKCVYLEVGVFQGASLLSAAYQNDGLFFGIDNFKEGTRNVALDNARTYAKDCKICLIEGDFWSCGFVGAEEVNVLFFDANTDAYAATNAFSKIKLADCFIIVCDNWSYASTRDNFRFALRYHDWNVYAGYQFLTDDDCDIKSWGNGWFVGVVEKSPLRTTYPKDMIPILDTDTPLWALQARTQQGLYSIKDYIALHEKNK